MTRLGFLAEAAKGTGSRDKIAQPNKITGKKKCDEPWKVGRESWRGEIPSARVLSEYLQG